MGTGTDVAINSAHVTLVKGDLSGIARARLFSLETVRNIRQGVSTWERGWRRGPLMLLAP